MYHEEASNIHQLKDDWYMSLAARSAKERTV